MELSKIAAISVLSLAISGCAIFGPREVEVVSKPIERVIAQPVLPRPLDLKEPYWYVVSEANLDEFLADVAKQSADQQVFVAMTMADYELMAYNMQEIKRYVRELGEVIIYYRTVTTKEENIEEETTTGDNGS